METSQRIENVWRNQGLELTILLAIRVCVSTLLALHYMQLLYSNSNNACIFSIASKGDAMLIFP
jgi:hypothetical protein